MTIVGKLKISPHVEKFQYSYWGFIAIYAVLLLILLFTLFCRKIFCHNLRAQKYICGEKMTNKRSEGNPFIKGVDGGFPDTPDYVLQIFPYSQLNGKV